MNTLERFIAFLFPSILITEPTWRSEWDRQQQEQFLRYAIFFFAVIAVGYIANYFFFDLPMGLEPTEFWLKLRLSISALATLCFAFYMSPLARRRYYKIPAVLACFIITYTQAKVAIWFHQDAWIFFYIFVITGVLFLGLNVFASTLYALATSLAGASVLREAGITSEYIASSTLVIILVTIIVRRSGLTEVRNFILNKENISNQTKLASMSAEYADRVRSFIPKVIADRMSDLIENKRLSVVEASIEALKAQKKSIACLFTDIRGYTQGSKSLDDFVVESVLPEVTACSDAIEERRGIPRKVGDLIFAYFDDDSLHLNVIRAISAGIDVSRLNEAMNVSSTQMAISRYILISCGEAMVGNFGGLDSSVEITALGTPVNFLSRVDDVTKHPELASRLRSGDLILSSEVVNLISQLGFELPAIQIDLKTLNISIRDFPETRYLYLLTPDNEILELMNTILDEVSSAA
ncbi:MAG: adenylate/guanylate cyclase domain-containing protein [bacterium]